MSHVFADQVRNRLKNHNLNTKAVVAMILFGMIIMTFIFSDFAGRRGGSLGIGSAAEVNGEIITVKDFQAAEQRMSDYYARFFGGKMDNEFQKKQIMQQALSELINRELASQKADQEKVYATDLEIQKIIIEDLPYFKKDGVFQKDLYKGLLSANRMTPSEFENQLKQDTKNQKIHQLFELGLGAGGMMQSVENELKSHKLNVAFVKLNSETLKAAVTPQEIKDSLAKTDFLTKVQEMYGARKASFETPEQVKASHILIRADMSNAAEVQKAEKKAQEILARTAKEDFGKLAAQVSEDPGSKAKNGDLGYFSKGKMVPAFEEAAFKLPVGKISGLVKTDYGFHIIKVTDKKAAKTTSFDEAKSGLAAQILAEEKLNQLTGQIEEALKNKDTQKVQDILAKDKLKWSETGLFDLTTEELPVVNSASLLKVALEISHVNDLSTSLVRDGDAQYILKLVDRKSESAQTAVDPKTLDLVTQQKVMSGYNQWVNDYRKSSKVQTNANLFNQ